MHISELRSIFVLNFLVMSMVVLPGVLGCGDGDDETVVIDDGGNENDTDNGEDNDCTDVDCESLEAECGEFDNGCGETLDCGECEGDGVCEDGQCICEPEDCADIGAECGEHDDGCGGTVDCGGCDDPNVCDGGQCVCQPADCDSLNAECGEHDDGCGGTVDCGGCDDPDDCTNGQCVCESLTCSDIGEDCGEFDDGCGGTVDCGSCFAEQTSCPEFDSGAAEIIETGSAGSGCASSFSPSEATVSEGDIVMWRDPSTCIDGYRVTSGSGPDDPESGELFQSGEMLTGDEFCVEFIGAGEYDFYCAIHEFTGTITVVE